MQRTTAAFCACAWIALLACGSSPPAQTGGSCNPDAGPAFTGTLQVFKLHESYREIPGDQGDWVAWFGQFHKEQAWKAPRVAPAKAAPKKEESVYGKPMKWLVALMGALHASPGTDPRRVVGAVPGPARLHRVAPEAARAAVEDPSAARAPRGAGAVSDPAPLRDRRGISTVPPPRPRARPAREAPPEIHAHSGFKTGSRHSSSDASSAGTCRSAFVRKTYASPIWKIPR